MASHWAFVIPIAMGYLLVHSSKCKVHRCLLLLVATITLFLWLYNGSLLVGYLLG